MVVRFRLGGAAERAGAKLFSYLVTSFTRTKSGFLLGSVYAAVTVLAPDHMGTLIMLSAASDDHSALRVGAIFGFCHSLGTGLILVLVFFLDYAFSLSSKRWEDFSDYAVGFSMILCALYFFMRENHYIRENADGTQTVISCECCTSASEAPALAGVGEQRRRADHVLADASAPSSASRSGAAEHFFAWSGREVNGAVWGTVQGLCCPVSLVGTTFAGAVDTPLGCAAFVVAFVGLTTTGMAVLAMGWSRLSSGGGSLLPPRAVFRATCTFTMFLGLAWIAAKAVGGIDSLEWTHRVLGH